MKSTYWLSALMAVFTLANFVHAELMLRPPGLEDGDQYRLMFTTSRLTDAVSGDPQFYDDFVQSVADDAPVVGSWNVEWQAFMAVGGLEIQERIDPGEGDEPIPVYRVDGELLIGDYLSFFGSSNTGLSVPLTITELETEPTFRAWTGTLANGRSGFAPNGDPFRQITVGSPNSLDASAFFDAGGPGPLANQLSAVYAISEVLTVPEPSLSSQVSLFFLFSVLLLRGRRP